MIDQQRLRSPSTCMNLLLLSGPERLMQYDRYHPMNCNDNSLNHHHPYHNHRVKNNHKISKSLDHTNHIHNANIISNIEWVKQFKQIPDTNIYIDAFECYHTIKKIHKSNIQLTNVHSILMRRNKKEQIVFILTHFHWDNYHGLENYHQQIFNEHTRNILYCSAKTANVISINYLIYIHNLSKY